MQRKTEGHVKVGKMAGMTVKTRKADAVLKEKWYDESLDEQFSFLYE